MPILTIRLSDDEMNVTKEAARRHGLTQSQFARRAITTAAAPSKKESSDFPFGVLKGKITYQQAMKILRG